MAQADGKITGRATPAPAQLTGPTLAKSSEASALDRIMWFGAIQIVTMAFGWILGYYLFGAVFLSIGEFRRIPNPTPAEIGAALAPIFHTVGTWVPVVAVIHLASLLVLTLALRELAKLDGARFSVPSIFMMVMMAGVAFAAVVFVPFINSIPGLVAQVPAGSSGTLQPAFASVLGSLLVYLVLLGAGVVLTLIGLVGGLILGLWRVGARHGETIIKLGAVFFIIPVLNVAAPILVLVGAHFARGRLVRGVPAVHSRF